MHPLYAPYANGAKYLAHPHHTQHHECQELIIAVKFDQEEYHADHDRHED